MYFCIKGAVTNTELEVTQPLTWEVSPRLCSPTRASETSRMENFLEQVQDGAGRGPKKQTYVPLV